jgi:hypothetical protein
MFKTITLREGENFKIVYDSDISSEIGVGYLNVTVLKSIRNRGLAFLGKVVPVGTKFKALYIISDKNDSDDFYFIGDMRTSKTFQGFDERIKIYDRCYDIICGLSKNMIPLDIDYQEFILRSTCVKLEIPSSTSLEAIQHSNMFNIDCVREALIEQGIIEGIANMVVEYFEGSSEYEKYLTDQEIQLINKKIVTNWEESSEEDINEGSSEDSENENFIE